MISLKVLSTIAAIALVLPMVTPTESFAQHRGPAAGRPAGGAPGGGMRRGGGGGPRFNGGGGWHRGGGFGPGAAAGVAGAIIGGAIASQGYGYGYGAGYYDPGYVQAYPDDQYYDDGAVEVVPAPGGDDSVAYCMQTYRSYNPRTGTYLGNDGYRHPCP
jgi:hypothetical protein